MNDDNEIVVFDPHDQGLAVNTVNVEQVIYDAIQRSIEEKDPNIAFNVGRTFAKAAQLSQFGITKLVYELKKQWAVFGLPDNFADRVFQELGITKVTLDRYLRIHEMRENDAIPSDFVQEIMGRRLEDQVSISTTWASGYSIDENQWERLANASDNAEVRQILREVTGARPRSNYLNLVMDRDGSIYAWDSNNNSSYVGNLMIDEDDPRVKKAINRIINNSNIRQSY